MDKKYRIQITELGGENEENKVLYDQEVINITMLADVNDERQVECILSNNIPGIARQIGCSKQIKRAVPLVAMAEIFGMSHEEDEDEEVSDDDNGD